MRLEFGWGARTTEMPAEDRHWHIVCRLSNGRFTGWSPGWITCGQGVLDLRTDSATFEMVTRQTDLAFGYFNSTVLEFEADPASEMELRLSGLGGRFTVAKIDWLA